MPVPIKRYTAFLAVTGVALDILIFMILRSRWGDQPLSMIRQYPWDSTSSITGAIVFTIIVVIVGLVPWFGICVFYWVWYRERKTEAR